MAKKTGKFNRPLVSNENRHKENFENRSNRSPIHTSFGAYETEEQAKSCNRTASRFVKVLNGYWKFYFAENSESIPEHFYQTNYNSNHWDTIPVPSNWELLGYEKPRYFSSALSSHSSLLETESEEYHPLFPIPKQYGIGCYITHFSIPDEFLNRLVYLNFDGVASCFFLWINGQPVGYSQDSRLSAEFDITSYIKVGDNVLAVQVMHFCEESDLECQTGWHLSGIYRSVTLYSKFPCHIKDYQIRTEFDSSYINAKLSVSVIPSIWKDNANYMVNWILYDASGSFVCKHPAVSLQQQTDSSVRSFSPEAILLEQEIHSVYHWTAETPYLYTLVIMILDKNGIPVDIESSHIGFRQVEISKDGILLLNGKRLVLRGITYQEHSAERGYVLGTGRIRQEMLAIKHFNFNAIRTNHSPLSPACYDLCDELGIYIIDEANLDTQKKDYNPPITLFSSYLERAVRMVIRDKNHPSVFIWSLGDQPYSFSASIYHYIKQYDPSRPIQIHTQELLSDFFSPEFKEPLCFDAIVNMEKSRPIIPFQYAAIIGNSGGGLSEYWKAVQRYPHLQGGFLYHFMDQPLLQKTPSGNSSYIYGDFHEKNPSFPYENGMQGILSPDLSSYPAAYEIKTCQAPVQISNMFLSPESIWIHNLFHTLDLSPFYLHWSVLQNGLCVHQGCYDHLTAKAGETEKLSLPFDFSLLQGECYLTLSLHWKEEPIYAKKDDEIYSTQLKLPCFRRYFYPMSVIPDNYEPEVQVTSREDTFLISNRHFSVMVSKYNGYFTRISYDKAQVSISGGMENFFRPPTAMDYFFPIHGESYAKQWKQAKLENPEQVLLSISFAKNKQYAIITASSEYNQNFFLVNNQYTIGAGGIIIHCQVQIPSLFLQNTAALSSIPRIGKTFTLPAGYCNIRWYGKGPFENYCDRKQAAKIGIYSSTVKEMQPSYPISTECGGREEVRWLEITNSKGCGFAIYGNDWFHFDVHYNSTSQYATSYFQRDLQPDSRIYLNLDYQHMGIGGMKQYQIMEGNHCYDFFLKPISPSIS